MDTYKQVMIDNATLILSSSIAFLAGSAINTLASHWVEQTKDRKDHIWFLLLYTVSVVVAGCLILTTWSWYVSRHGSSCYLKDM